MSAEQPAHILEELLRGSRVWGPELIGLADECAVDVGRIRAVPAQPHEAFALEHVEDGRERGLRLFERRVGLRRDDRLTGPALALDDSEALTVTTGAGSTSTVTVIYEIIPK